MIFLIFQFTLHKYPPLNLPSLSPFSVQSNSITRSTSSSSQSGWDHDVFLSFRGEDTRKNFTDHLYSALTRAGMHTFRDEFRRPEIESEDENEASQVVGVDGQNEDVQSNSIITRITSSSSQSRWDHDVFLSFRGEDTRRKFTDHLYNALVVVGIRTFRDDEGLNRGEIISSELLNAIRRSRISIVIFSKGYASSRWCLDELAEIVNCMNTIGHTLLPVFYDVDPSVVRKQTDTFAEAFIRHVERFPTDMESVQRWREALTQAANCSGWSLANE